MKLCFSSGKKSFWRGRIHTYVPCHFFTPNFGIDVDFLCFRLAASWPRSKSMFQRLANRCRIPLNRDRYFLKIFRQKFFFGEWKMYNYNYNWFTLHPVPHQFVPGRVDCRKFDNGAVLFLSCIIQFYFIFFIFFSVLFLSCIIQAASRSSTALRFRHWI
jgi:hypothetical protein